MIVVVGAGLTGLCLSRELAARGAAHIVFEADDVPGGVVRTIIRDGVVLENGPQRLRLTSSVRALVHELGLDDELIAAASDLPLGIYRDGRLRRVPFSVAELFATDLLGRTARLRLLLEPFTAPERPDETVAAFLTRRFGRRAYEDLLGPLFGGLYASDPADMLVRHALAPLLHAMGVRRSLMVALLKRRGRVPAPPRASFLGGMQSLIGALHEGVRSHVHLAEPVRSIAAERNRFRLVTPSREVIPDHIVLTCAADVAAELLRSIAPDAAERLEQLHYNPLAVVHLRTDTMLSGMGYQVSFRERSHTRGVTFNHAMFGETRAGTVTAFLGGAQDPGVVAWNDDALGDAAAREFTRVTGVSASPVHVARVRVPAWDRTWVALDGLRLPEGVHACAAWESRIGIPGRIEAAKRMADTLQQC